MAEARRLEAWDHTAYLAVTVMNLLRAKGRRLVAPAELNPYRKARRERVTDMDEVKAAFERLRTREPTTERNPQ